MATTDFRNKANGATSTTFSTSALNALGSTFSTQTLLTPTFVTNPYTGGESTWISSAAGTATTAGRLAWNLATAQETTGMVSVAFSLAALPAATLQLVDLQVKNSDGTQRSVFSPLIKTSGMIQVGYTNDAKTAKFADTGITIAAGTNYRLNMWVDIGGQTCSLAVYDLSSGSQVGSTWTVTAADLGATTTLMAAVFWGKLSTAAINTTLYMSDFAATIGKAADFGASPNMSAPTSPTMSFVPHMDLEPGRRVQIYARVTPTTSGATETGITCTSGTPVDLSGTKVTDAPAFTWGAPTTTNEANRTREATTPYYRKTLVYPVTVTGTDSTNLAATQVVQVRVFGHDQWIGGKAAIFIPPKAS